MAGWLSGFDSVYSAHVTSYGSIAAMYVPVPHQTRSRQFITWLDDDQLHIMHQTESLGVNYDLVTSIAC